MLKQLPLSESRLHNWRGHSSISAPRGSVRVTASKPKSNESKSASKSPEQTMQAGMDSALKKLAARGGQPKSKPTTSPSAPDDKASQVQSATSSSDSGNTAGHGEVSATGTRAASKAGVSSLEGGKAQQQRLPAAVKTPANTAKLANKSAVGPAGKAPVSITAAPAAAAGLPPAAVKAGNDQLKLDDLDVDRLWKEVDAAIKSKSSKGEDLGFESLSQQDTLPMPASSSGVAMGPRGFGPATTTSSTSSTTTRLATGSATVGVPRGFGPPASSRMASSEASTSAAISKPLKAATPSGSSPASTRQQRKGDVIRIMLYSTDEASALEAISDAGLTGRVVIEGDLKLCHAVVTAKLSRNGRPIRPGQGERTAVNAGIPFYCVGRNMTGRGLKAALLPLLNPKAAAAIAAAEAANTSQPLTREAARIAVRAIKFTGKYFEPPKPSGASIPADFMESLPGAAEAAPVPASPENSDSDGDDDLAFLGEMEVDEDEEEEEEEEEEIRERQPAVLKLKRRIVVGSGAQRLRMARR